MASKHDGAAVVQQHRHDQRIAGRARHRSGSGTNDGNVQVSRDGGATWKNVVDKVTGVPKETHVSRVEASHFDAGTAYVTFDGHRTDDHKPYVFVTKDFGETWTSLVGQPADGQRQRHHARTRRTATCCTSAPSTRFYISLNGGKEWKRFMNGLPTVRDRRHPRASARQRPDPRHARPQHLDHGRHHGAAAADAKTTMKADATLFDIRPASRGSTTSRRRSWSRARSTSAARTRRAAPRSATG